jgi:hypothetical protein
MFYWRPVFFGLPVLYILAIFEIGSPFMSRPACTVILFVLSWVAGMTGVHHHAQLFIGLANFLPKQKV